MSDLETPASSDLGRLLAERARIDRALLQEHSKSATVLFTDIVGSTATYEAKGDIEGLRRVRAHNDALFPIVKDHRGRIIKTIGDAIMAAFETPGDGARCAIAMQLRLQSLFADHDEPIEIRAGLHCGQVLIDGDDLFGDTVNTAARVASHAGPGEVWTTETLFDAVASDGKDLRAIDRQALAFKGKAEKVACVRLKVSDDDAVVGTVGPDELLMVEVLRGRDGLRVALIDGAGDKGTVKQFEERVVADEELQKLTAHFRALAHGGGQSESYLAELKARGEDLAKAAFGPQATGIITGTERTHLRLHLDDALIQIPWELSDIGGTSLGIRFAMGRMVSAEGAHKVPRRRSDVGEVAIVANPTGDLDAASQEGRLLANLLTEAGANVTLHDGPLTKADLCKAIAAADLVHFAGHATTEGGQGALLCNDGPLTATAMQAALVKGGASEAPALFFVNACHMAGEGWTSEAFARAALNLGIEHFVAPTWEIPDDDALFFALRFWEGALSGRSYGESARRARVALAQDGKRPLSFAGYVLYGDPRRRFPTALREAIGREVLPTRSERSGEFETISVAPPSIVPPSSPRPSTPRARDPVAGERTSKEEAQPKREPVAKGVPTWAMAAGAAAVVAGAAVIAWQVSKDVDPNAVAIAPQAVTPPAPPDRIPTPRTPAVAKTGPIALSVLPFKNATGDAKNAPLQEGMMEAAVTALAGAHGTKLIERGQIDVDIEELEFSNSAYVDPATRATLGRIVGAEVVVLGSVVASGERLRALTRFVHVETGEVLATVKTDGAASDLFAFQDAVAEAVLKKTAAVRARLRPKAGHSN